VAFPKPEEAPVIKTTLDMD